MKHILLALACSTVIAAAGDTMKAFPPAEAGMVRHVLPMPPDANEDDLKVELIVGKTVRTDGVNRNFFTGKIETVNIEGWGFVRYVVKNLGPMAGTRMGVPPGTPKVEKFVRIGGEPFLVRYNSRLPIVIYIPEGAEVRYRIWRTDPETKPVPQG